MTAQPKPKQAWIVISPVKPPDDWGFKPNKWKSNYIRVTGSKLHAIQLRHDLQQLEIKNAKARRANFNLDRPRN